MKGLHSVALLSFIVSLPLQGQKPLTGKPPLWVRDVKPDLAAVPAASGGSIYYLLIDEQMHVEKKEFFSHYAYRILTGEGIQEMSDVMMGFDPTYQKLTIHQVSIVRGGNVIDQLVYGVRTVQREESLDRKLYDGSLTSIVNLRDVRVGDVVEFSYTVSGSNPVYDGHFGYRLYFDFQVPYDQLYYRMLTSPGRNLTIRPVNSEVTPRIQPLGNELEYTWMLGPGEGVVIDKQQPIWYDPFGHVLITDFKNWHEVRRWAYPKYEITPTDLAALKPKIAPFFDQLPDTDRPLAIIRFVQDEVRYLGFESGLNSHQPHRPLKVFDQRFGDCKDKSLLLCAMLNVYGIEAYPVLVNSTQRGHVTEVLPAINAFDHCITQVKSAGGTYYIDPTNYSQGGTLETMYTPEYSRGLVIDKNLAELNRIESRGQAEIREEFTFDVSEVGGPVQLRVATTYSGAEADGVRSQFGSNTTEAIQKNYLTFYGNVYPDIEVAGSLSVDDDRTANRVVVLEKYTIPTFWKSNEGDEDNLYAELYALAFETYANVQKSASRKGPYGIAYPISYRQVQKVNLPVDWTVEESDTEIASDYYRYKYSLEYDARQLTLSHHYQTLADHVPVEAVPKFVSDHQAMMNNLSFYLTYNTSIANAEGVNITAAVSVALLAVLAAFGALRLYRYDPAVSVTGKGDPIGGWLVLVAIGLCISPFSLIYDFFFVTNFIDNRIWASAIAQEDRAFLAVVVFEMVTNILLIFFSGIVLVLFFQRRTSAPRVISIYMLVGFLTIALDTLAVYQFNTEISPDDIRDLARAFMSAAIWVPYFHFSDRVKRTFVVRYD